MNAAPITYDNLFALLVSLGFQEQPSDKAVRTPRVFFHEQTDTILTFGRKTNALVTPADMLSTEVHLQGKRVVDRPLESLLSAMSISE